MRFTMERLMLIWIFVSSPKAYEVKINSVSKLVVKGGTECSSVVEQWHCKLCAAGSIPAFPIPMNCNHWNLFLLLRSVPVFLVGRFMPFKSAHWIFLNRGSLWTKKVVRIAESTMDSHGFASMVTVNIVQTLDVWTIVVNIGRVYE